MGVFHAPNILTSSAARPVLLIYCHRRRFKPL